jgi:hypothetical protein
MKRLAFFAPVLIAMAMASHAHAVTLSPSQVAEVGYGKATYQMDGGSTSIYIPPTNPPPATGSFSYSSAYGGTSVACLGGTVVDPGTMDNTPPSGFYSNPGAYCADFPTGGLTFTDLVTWHYYSNGSPTLGAYTSTGSIQTGFCVAGIGCASGSPTYEIDYGAYTFSSMCTANYGSSCSVSGPANACGTKNTNSGTYLCNGSCSASTPGAPANPSGYGTSCTVTSNPNSCGMTNQASGTITCGGSCSASKPAAPSDSLCAPKASCTVTPSSGYQGQTTFTYKATASGGNGSYTYSWSGPDGLSGTAASIAKVFQTAGSKTGAQVVVTSNGKSTTAVCTPSSVTVTSCVPTLNPVNPVIDLGQSPSLQWSVPSACASSCVFSDGTAVSGSSGTYTPQTPPSGPTANYAVTCPANSSYTNNTSVTVRVPTASISAAPARVKQGDTSTITWSATNVDSCDITRNGTAWQTGLTADANRAVNGSAPDTISAQTTYVLSCVNDSGKVQAQATAQTIVNLIPNFQEF